MNLIMRNPWLNENSFRDFTRGGSEPTMSLKGTVAKTFLLMGVMLAGAAFGAWLPHAVLGDATLVARALGPPIMQSSVLTTIYPVSMNMAALLFWTGGFGLLLSLIGFVAWFFIDWLVESAQVLAAIAFAFVQGMCGVFIVFIAETRYPGAALVAAIASCALLLAMLVLHRHGIGSDLSAFKAGIMATVITIVAGAAVVGMMRLFGHKVSTPHQLAVVYWGLLCGIMVFLAQDLSRSFGYIEDAIELGAPKWMEWRAAFGLMVALVLIYFAMLKLVRILMKSRHSRNQFC
jgi:uncharacterized YccA/Bax inhibitor family protein